MPFGHSVVVDKPLCLSGTARPTKDFRMPFGRSVVIGKFYPPHRGHKHLIDTASAQSRRVTVIVCERPTDTIPGEIREAWLREIHPAAEVMLIDDRYDENDTAVW